MIADAENALQRFPSGAVFVPEGIADVLHARLLVLFPDKSRFHAEYRISMYSLFCRSLFPHIASSYTTFLLRIYPMDERNKK